MKKIFIYLLILIMFHAIAFAIESDKIQKQNNISKIEDLTVVNLYDYFYKLDANNIPRFTPITNEQKKGINKNSKKIYKNVLKSERAFQKGINSEGNIKKQINYYKKALEYNPQNYFASALLSGAFLISQDFNSALAYAKYTIETSRPEFNFVYCTAGFAANSLHDYLSSIDYLNKYLKNLNNDNFKSFALYIQATNYFALKDYQKAIYYANLSMQKDNKYIKENTLVKYYCYYAQKNLKLAKQEAWKLVKLDPSPENYIMLADSTENPSEKLKYLKNAKLMYSDPKDIFRVNYKIAIIEQNKINNIHKTMGVYSQKPDWDKISNENIGSVAYWNKRQDEFFESTNNCIANYKGSNLAKCFEDIIINEKEKTSQLRKMLYDEQMLYLQRQQLKEIQYNNYLKRQQNYEISRPKYTNTTITPVGNTYYMNSYTY